MKIKKPTLDFVLRSQSIWTGETLEPGILASGDIIIKEGKIAGVLPYGSTGAGANNLPVVDVGKNLVTPGFIDAHTHLVHYGTRENELAMRLAGKTYMEIHQAGGGIFNTMKATRNATKAELYGKAKQVLKEMLQFGVTTVEAKSGYGLDYQTEVQCMEVASQLAMNQEVDIVSTYMGAHAVPPEWKANRQGYLDWLVAEMLPQVAKLGLAEFVDIFCEKGVFSPKETRAYLDGARKLGFKLKVHADEIAPSQGAEIAAKFGAVSAEHLMAVTDQGIADMAKSGTVAVLLPGTTFFLQAPKYAPAQKMRQAGVNVAIASDYNPGSSPLSNLQFAMRLGCFAMGLTPEEALAAVTTEAAKAVSRDQSIGRIAEGLKADLLVHDVENVAGLFYAYGHNTVKTVYKDGKCVVTSMEEIC